MIISKSEKSLKASVTRKVKQFQLRSFSKLNSKFSFMRVGRDIAFLLMLTLAFFRKGNFLHHKLSVDSRKKGKVPISSLE